MYSTLLDDDEYEPLLMLYLTTTGPLFQNQTKAQIVGYALKTVVYRDFANESVPIDVLEEVRKSLNSRSQQSTD